MEYGKFDEVADRKKYSVRTKLIDSSGNPISGTNPLPITQEGDYAVQFAENSGDSNIEYYGKAVIGSATSAAVWQIKKIDNTSGVSITWADSNESFDNIWDSRESLSYG